MASLLLRKHSIILFVLFFLLSGCGGNRYAENTQEIYNRVQSRLTNLGKRLDSGAISNAAIAQSYAKSLSEQKPKLATVANTLRKDATSAGTPYQSLKNRLNAVNRKPQNEYDYRNAIQELNNINIGSDPVVFNETLLDVVNTLADLSDGQLPRINIPKTHNTGTATTANQVPGSYLVGNPNYGSWRTDNSGHSFWAWYGQYAFFSSLFSPSYGSRVIYRDNWYSRPHYSYYNDYGRSTYGTYRDRNNWKNTARDLTRKGKPPATATKDYRSFEAKRRSSVYQQIAGKQYGAKTRSYNSRAPPGRSSTSRRSSFQSFFSPSARGTSSGSRSFWGGK